MDDDSILVYTDFKRAELLSKEAREKYGLPEEGAVVIESCLSKKEMREEFDDIMGAFTEDGIDRAFELYVHYMRETVHNIIKIKEEKLRLRGVK